MRVVLPTASPGVFSAIMVGFGRAVGETMIVLMATGNTPMMDWSIFNGIRTLSANIAVEIPEAPYGGTLYRTLFLSAALLFLMTLRRQHRRRGHPAAAARTVQGGVMADRREPLRRGDPGHLAGRQRPRDLHADDRRA